jgi:transposase-like protein
MAREPKTLQEAILYFADPINCREYLVARRWPKGVTCPRCGSEDVLFLEKYNRWHCRAKHEAPQFTLKTGSIMEDSPVGLDKWLTAIWLIVNCKNGISSYEIHRALGITQKTAWFLDHRIRLAMQDDLTGGMLGGEVEVDETFIGGKVRNMHKSRKREVQKHSQKGDKTIVLGILERASESKEKRIRATVVADRKRTTMQAEVSGVVEKGAKVYSDDYGIQWRMDDQFEHEMVDHLTTYVDGQVHTQGIENFWSLLKRCVGGTYISVEPFHLFRYVDQQAYRFNTRKMTDAERFDVAVKGIVGKQLTFEQLTGKTAEAQA